MNEIQMRIMLQNTLLNYVSSLMNQNNISAIMMEDALNKVLLQIKEQINIELINSFTSPIEEEERKEEEEMEE